MFSPHGAKQVFVMVITDAADAGARLPDPDDQSPVAAGEEPSGFRN
jgi:hypothetical protein